MKAYMFEIGCPLCGGEVEHKAHGVPAVSEVRAIARCLKCGAEMIVVINLVVRENDGPGAVCGTCAGYSRHRRHDEVPCEACLRARADESRKQKARRRELRVLVP